MRRVLRHLLMPCSAVSLLLCVAACALWVRSYWQRDSWVEWVTTPTSAHHGAQRTRHVFWDRGRLYVEWMTQGVMVRELQHGGWPGPIPPLEASSASRWSHGTPEARPVDLTFEFHRNVRPQGATTRVRGLGLRIERRNWPPPIEGRWEVGWDLVIPFWMVAVVLGVMPTAHGLILMRSRRRRRRRSAGLCAGCGYDLRESRERCPECGAAVAR